LPGMELQGFKFLFCGAHGISFLKYVIDDMFDK